MTTTDTGVGIDSVVLSDLARLDSVLDDLLSHSGIGRTREEVVTANALMTRIRRRTDAAGVQLVGWLDTVERGDLAAVGRGKLIAATTLEQACGMDPTQAKRDVRLAQALRDDLPRVAEAYEAGETSREHVEAAKRVRDRVRTSDWRQKHRAIDGYLAAQSAVLNLDDFVAAGKHLLDTLDPSRLDGKAPDPDRRKATFAIGDDGWGWLTMLLQPYDAAMVKALLDAHAGPDVSSTEEDEDGTPVPVEDHRTTGERTYDALLGILRSGLASGEPDGPGLQAEIRVVATVDGFLGHSRAHVDGLGLISLFELTDLACTATFRRVLLDPTGTPLDVGHGVRYATVRQRAALDVRDRGCVIPGCRRPAKHCQAHHITHHRDGGPTDLWNLALVCERHHREIHHGRWRLEVIEGVCWVTPRDDPYQRRQRNLRHRPTTDRDPLGNAR